ncbi:signal-induced proliferation-associated 1-like protein 3 isoform X3 [Clupea harengus]|uniref:Signal-induced proliferation-associated 1-like protein 3 isoform X3 n=1 Tax=Clupea harengus TaxID=7950 RepID=A0A6P8FZG5_CLUHA|nr:signal-induced proliferation-associated 1-like protein 3 isoform X3 [Clupea harengus]
MYTDSGVCDIPQTQPLQLLNGHTPPIDPAAAAVASVPARMSVPKMGVRARISDWPPRREQSHESLQENGQCAYPSVDERPARVTLVRMPWRRARDSEFGDAVAGFRGGLASVSAFAPLRQRSSSEVTLSEQDEAEVESRVGLIREYGSTSSIDMQGIPEQSILHMLNHFQQERPGHRGTSSQLEDPPEPSASSSSIREERGETRVRKKSGGTESSLGTSSLFRKLRSASRGEIVTGRGDTDDCLSAEHGGASWICTRSLAHYDAQSILFDLHEAATQRGYQTQRRNTATGASAASVSVSTRTLDLGGFEPRFCSADEMPGRDSASPAAPADPGSPLLLSCPQFLNETGGPIERNLSFLSSLAEQEAGEGGMVGRHWLRCSNTSISVLEVPPEQQALRLETLRLPSIEHVDRGARYYHDHFLGKEHCNYFGTDDKLGPVALSIRREKLEDTRDLKDQYQYRLIVRTCELVTLRGAILEDAVPSTARHGTVRGLPLKEVLEHIVPELNLACLRLALNTPKATEQLLKLDEQGLSQKHKVGILLCRAGQSTEEEMYNNEEASPAFSTFLQLLGDQVLLRGFTKYAAQLDTKTDSTGTHSVYTTYQGYEIMFHVSTMLPYMPNNPQQLLRKRHIGNDIVTIIFQEPGALPFTPQNIRSHFQHVFIIVRVHNPCSDSTSYSVAVTRMKDVPPFGPPIPPSNVTFRDPEAFRSFLLAKVINAESAAHKSEKFHTMATRTRQEYLRDLAQNCVSSTPLDTSGKLNNLISMASKRRERVRPREGAELGSSGALTWRVRAQDFSGGGMELPCALGISGEFVLLADCTTKEVVFNCFCADIIGWAPERLSLKIYFGRGDHISLRVPEGCAQDIREVVQRLKALTVGCETVDMTLRRNGLGQLGFHVRVDGTVSEVEEYGFAWQAGLRQGSRLVEICKVAAVTLTHEQMIDLLRTSVTVKVLIIPPHEEGEARRGCTEEYEMKTLEQRDEAEPLSTGYHPSLRQPAWRWDRPLGTSPLPQCWTPVGAVPLLGRPHKNMMPIPYREPQHLSSKRPVSYPENHYSMSPVGSDRNLTFRNPSASFSSPSPGLAAGLGPGLSRPFVHYKSPDRFGTQRSLLTYEPPLSVDISSGDSSGFTSQESTMERAKNEPMWHVPAYARGVSVAGVNQRKPRRQDTPENQSPNRHSKGEVQYSSHSSSNTLSSNASSSHSDERWFDGTGGSAAGMGGLSDPSDPDPEQLGTKGSSSDSGIDASVLHASSTPGGRVSRGHIGAFSKPLSGSATYSGLQELSGACSMGEMSRRDSSPGIPAKSYRTRTFQSPGGTPSNDSFKPRSYTPQRYKTPAADKSQPFRPSTATVTLGSAQSSPKASYGKTKQAAWQQEGNNTAANTTGTSGSDSSSSSKSRQVDMNSKNVFGQPRLRASLRDLRSPRRSHKSTVEDDLKKLIIMDNPADPVPQREKSQRRNLQRTFSDESLTSSRRDPGYPSTPLFDCHPTSSDLLFSCTLPNRRHNHLQHMTAGAGKKVPLSASELSLSEMMDKVPPLRRLDPGLMPLPDTACGLEWSSLVSAAKAYEVQRAVSLFSLSEPNTGLQDSQPAISPVHFHTPQTPRTTPTFSSPSDEVQGDLPGRLFQLEVMLKQLNTDLEKEKEDKVVLLAEMANLRQNNQRLQEESHSTSEQLRKFSQLFTETGPDRK